MPDDDRPLHRGDRVEHLGLGVFDQMIVRGDVGTVTRIANGWVRAQWPRTDEELASRWKPSGSRRAESSRHVLLRPRAFCDTEPDRGHAIADAGKAVAPTGPPHRASVDAAALGAGEAPRQK